MTNDAVACEQSIPTCISDKTKNEFDTRKRGRDEDEEDEKDEEQQDQKKQKK